MYDLLQAFFKMYQTSNLIIRKMKNQKLFNIIQKFFSDYANVHIFPKCFPFEWRSRPIFTFNSYAASAFFSFRLKTKQKVNWYSTSPGFFLPEKGNKNLTSDPQPVLTLDLIDIDYINTYKGILKGKGGIYSFVNTVNGNQYIGSAKDFYLRLKEHLENKKSNVALQRAFDKYGLDKFNFSIYEYFTYESKIISHQVLTDLENSYINRFNFDNLYNFKAIATSSLGYKHTEEARLKMKDIYKDKNNHPMFGKTLRKY